MESVHSVHLQNKSANFTEPISRKEKFEKSGKLPITTLSNPLTNTLSYQYSSHFTFFFLISSSNPPDKVKKKKVKMTSEFFPSYHTLLHMFTEAHYKSRYKKNHKRKIVKLKKKKSK